MAAVAVAVPTVERGLTRTAGGASAVVSGTGTVRTAAEDTPSRTEVGERLLAAMTRAVRKGDEKAFTAAAAWGHPGARDRLRETFSGLRALPLASFTLTVDRTRSIVAPVKGQPSGSFVLPALATYRLRSWDTAPVQVPLHLVVGQVRGAWGILEDRTTVDDDTAERLEPWLFPDQYVTKTRNVLVIGDSRKAAQLRRLATTLEELVADVRRVWPERTWNGKVVVYATTTTRFVRSWYGRSAAGDSDNGDRASFVAKVATLRGPDATRPGAVRLVVTPYLLQQGDRRGYVDILRHEMTHVATARLSGDVPVWLVEGAAEYTGFARRTTSGDLDATTTLGRHGLTRAEVVSTARGTWRPTLKIGPEFYRGSEQAVDEAYNSAFITCLYIVDRYGEKALRRLYTRTAELASADVLTTPARMRAHERTALREVLRTDRARLTKDVGAFATRLRNRLVFR